MNETDKVVDAIREIELIFDQLINIADQLINIADLVQLQEDGEEVFFIKIPDIAETQERFDKALAVLKQVAETKET